MQIAHSEYWHLADGSPAIAFRSTVSAPVLTEELRWRTDFSVSVYGATEEDSFEGGSSLLSLMYAVGYVVLCERQFLLKHTGHLGWTAHDIEPYDERTREGLTYPLKLRNIIPELRDDD